jgi:hypothetical protein
MKNKYKEVTGLRELFKNSVPAFLQQTYEKDAYLKKKQKTILRVEFKPTSICLVLWKLSKLV